MHNKFEINQTKIKGGCQSRSGNPNSKSDLPLVKGSFLILMKIREKYLCATLHCLHSHACHALLAFCQRSIAVLS